MVSDIDRRKGLSATAAAEVLWGLTPIYWKAVATVSTHELLALRVLWAIPFAVVLLTLRDAWGDVWRAVSSWHTLSALLLTAALIGCNWFAFLIAMENGQVLQSSLGYFITPLVSILLGFVFLGERLRAVQWVAVALAAAGVATQILAVGELPWIALILAGSFGLYGLLRKTVAVPALPGLFVALLRGSKTDPQRPLPTDPLTTDSVRRRPTKLSHLIEDVTCEDGLRLLPRPTARSKALPDDQLVPEEGVLHTGLLMVARVLLPLSPSSLLHLSDRAVARGRSWSPSRHGGCPGRWNDDRRATRTRSLVDATRVVGRVRREAGDVAFDLVDQIEGRRRVVNMPAGQGVSDDHARSVDAQMKLLPAAYTASAMFHGRPFTFTQSREPGTVDDEMYACARGEAAKCKVEVLTTS